VGSALGLTVLLKKYGMGGSIIVFALGIMIGLSAIMVGGGGAGTRDQSDKISHIDTVSLHVDDAISHIDTVILRSSSISILSSPISILSS